MDNHIIQMNEEKIFIIKLALDLVVDAIYSLKNNDISLLATYLDYLQKLCDYLTITFDAPKCIESNSEAFSALQYLTTTLTNDYQELQRKIITAGSNTKE
jgi:hypothetical protein